MERTIYGLFDSFCIASIPVLANIGRNPYTQSWIYSPNVNTKIYMPEINPTFLSKESSGLSIKLLNRKTKKIPTNTLTMNPANLKM